MKNFSHFHNTRNCTINGDNGVGEYLSVQLRYLNPSEHTNNNQPNLKGGEMVQNCTLIWRKSGKVITWRLNHDTMGLGRGMLVLSSIKFRVVQNFLSNLFTTTPESGGAYKLDNQPEQDNIWTRTKNFWTAKQEWSNLGNFILIPRFKTNANNQPISQIVPVIVNWSLVSKNNVFCQCTAVWNGCKTVVKGWAFYPHFWKKFSYVIIHNEYLKDI